MEVIKRGDTTSCSWAMSLIICNHKIYSYTILTNAFNCVITGCFMLLRRKGYIQCH